MHLNYTRKRAIQDAPCSGVRNFDTKTGKDGEKTDKIRTIARYVLYNIY